MSIMQRLQKIVLFLVVVNFLVHFLFGTSFASIRIPKPVTPFKSEPYQFVDFEIHLYQNLEMLNDLMSRMNAAGAADALLFEKIKSDQYFKILDDYKVPAQALKYLHVVLVPRHYDGNATLTIHENGKLFKSQEMRVAIPL